MTEYPFLIRDCIPSEFIESIKSYAVANADKFKPNGHGRRFFMFPDHEPFLGLKQVLAGRFDITEWVLDPFFMNFIGHQTDGGAVHPHIDPNTPCGLHTRINIMTSVPDSGGMPLLDGIEVPVSVGDVWLNLADYCHHSSTPVIGSIPRIVLSLGMQVAPKDRDPISRRYQQWREENK